ncbi:MAG: hypothetical protein MK212_14685 [Saprospiraceae bacterium]|nr:hypothetical protein [Saprospiraceae bacterium]
MRYILTWFCLIAHALSINAQESNYWTQQYGARSNMLGGAVVAGLEDNSALYYNPAAISFIKTSNLSLNTSAYQYAETYHHNGAGQGIDLFSRRARLYPQMSSGLLTKNPDRRLRLGFCVLSRYQNNFDANQRHEGYYNIIPQHPGKEYYVGAVELQNTFSDTWMGLGIGYRISEHLSIGTSWFVSYRNQRYRSSIFTRTSFEENGVSVLSVYSVK